LLLMVCAGGSIAMMVSAISATQFGGSAQTAYRLGQEVIDRAMGEPLAVFNSPALSACRGTWELGLLGNGLTTGASAGNSILYDRLCIVSLVPLSPTNSLGHIGVTVRWTDGGGRVRSMRMGMSRAQ